MFLSAPVPPENSNVFTYDKIVMTSNRIGLYNALSSLSSSTLLLLWQKKENHFLKSHQEYLHSSLNLKSSNTIPLVIWNGGKGFCWFNVVKEEQEVDNKRESRKCLVMLTVSHSSQTKALFFWKYRSSTTESLLLLAFDRYFTTFFLILNIFEVTEIVFFDLGHI